MKSENKNIQQMPLNIVGSNKFGRYNKISDEQTYNMIISDGWLVPFAGYRQADFINNDGEGRSIYTSFNLGYMYIVVDDNIWQYDKNLNRSFIGKLLTFSGDVFIADNNTDQVCLSDSENLYIYNANTSVFTTLTADELGFTPGYITYQNTRFISPDIKTNLYRLSNEGNGLLWPFDAQHVGEISTKPTKCVACVRFPSRGNLMLVFGNTVGEQWMDVGATLFPYQRNQSTNIDYGCINPASIATNQDVVCWVGINEQSGPAIMYTTGAEVKKISTDGIDFKLANLKNPQDCYGFMVRLDGHLCYVVSWPTDNLTYLYDFNTDAFFTLTDENMNVFIVKRIAFFNNKYYFVSLNDGNLYELDSEFFTYSYGEKEFEIPLIRIPAPITMPDQSRFNVSYTRFFIESGTFDYHTRDTNNIPHIDLSLSRDGGVNYGSNVKKIVPAQGIGQNRLNWTSLGSYNDLRQQFRFHGLTGRFVCKDGVTGIYQ